LCIFKYLFASSHIFILMTYHSQLSLALGKGFPKYEYTVNHL